MANVKTIKVKEYGGIFEELEAAGAITPGHVLELTSAGKVQANSSAGGPVPVSVALEDELQGNTTRDAYSSGDKVQVWHVQPGEVFYGIVDSIDPAVGDLLEVHDDGTLQAASSGTVQFVVLETKTTDDDSNDRIKVRRI